MLLSRSNPSIALAAAILVASSAAPAQAQPAPAPAPATASPNQVAPMAPQVRIVVTGAQGPRVLALPIPIAPLGVEIQAKVVEPFFTALSEDLSGFLGVAMADSRLFPKGFRPPASKEQSDAWIASGAEFLIDTRVLPKGDRVEVEAHLIELKTRAEVLGRTYTGEPRAARRIGHTLANDLVRQFTGRPGPFLSKVFFSSDRDKSRKADGKEIVDKEIYVMDFDGDNQRRLTFNFSLSLAPDISPDGSRVAYQSYGPSGPGLYTATKDGLDKKAVPVRTDLNASPSFSPDGKALAYCGSIAGNPEIFTVNLDGTALKRLTESASIDATPRFSPNGREIAFTSNRQGSPQIYLMDIEGANVRRVTFAGSWNDEAAWSPDGSRLAFACRNEGDFQICVLDLLTGKTVQITSTAGAHENPTWSPDGSKLAWELTRNGSTQIVVGNAADGSALKTITSGRNNFSPVFSKTLE